MNKIPSISDALETVIQAVDADVAADSSIDYANGAPKRVYFMHGTDDDLFKLLAEYTKAGTGKYPLVWLVRKPGIAQSLVEDGNSFRTDAKVRLIICTLTKPELRPDDRETKSFKNILYPIFQKLIYQLSISAVFGQPSVDDMNITFSDNYSWGKLKMQEVGDFIDAIDISRISLAVRDLSCLNQFIKN